MNALSQPLRYGHACAVSTYELMCIRKEDWIALVDVLLAQVGDSGLIITYMHLQRVLDRLRLVPGLLQCLRLVVNLLRRLVTRLVEQPVAEVPQEETPAVQRPHGLLGRGRIRGTVRGRDAISDLAREENCVLESV